MVVRLASQGSAHGYASATATLQVWDERWLFARLLLAPAPSFLVYLAGIAAPSFVWSLVIWASASLLAWRMGGSLQRRMGPPRLRVLGREHPARTWLRQCLSWLYRLAMSDWPQKR